VGHTPDFICVVVLISITFLTSVPLRAAEPDPAGTRLNKQEQPAYDEGQLGVKQYFSAWELEALAQAFVGVTADGIPAPGLFPISNVPLVPTL